MKRLICKLLDIPCVEYSQIRALWRFLKIITENYVEILEHIEIYDPDTRRIRKETCNEAMNLIETMMGIK